MPPEMTASAPKALAKTTHVKLAPKPWTPPETQKTDLERSINRMGAPVPDNLKYDFDSSRRDYRRVTSGRANAPPVLDRLGYRISRASVRKATRRSRGRMSIADVHRATEKRLRIAEVMGVPEERWNSSNAAYFEDQVARDLDIPCHTVAMPEYEEWNRRRFKMDPRLWDERPSEECERNFALSTGCAFRE